MKRLIHFSEKPFAFDPARAYLELPSEMIALGKPTGLWLSDESEDDGWKRWCQESYFRLGGLAYSTVFECDISRWCVLRNADGLKDFSEKYGFNRFHGLDMKLIDWERVKKDFGGILISPYIWSCRLSPETHWYYGWDCASGCAWDLSTVRLAARKAVVVD